MANIKSDPAAKIENVHVDNVSGPDGRDYAIGWSSEGCRFHVWVKRGEIEETVYKNPALGIERGAPGHFEPRQLNRSSKATGAMFAAVIAIVQRDGLVAKARIADKLSIERARAVTILHGACAELEAEVLEAWRLGLFAASPPARSLLARSQEITRQLAELGQVEGA